MRNYLIKFTKYITPINFWVAILFLSLIEIVVTVFNGDTIGTYFANIQFLLSIAMIDLIKLHNKEA